MSIVPSLREFARSLGFSGLRPGPHATWARPLATKDSLGQRIARARKRLSSEVVPSVTVDGDGAHDDRTTKEKAG